MELKLSDRTRLRAYLLSVFDANQKVQGLG